MALLLRTRLGPTLASCLALLANALATEEHLLRVYLPLVTSPEIEIVAVPFSTSFGALEESTLHAMTWPCQLSGRDEEKIEQRTGDLNLVSLLGVSLSLERKEAAWQLKLDLTALRPIPVDLREERLAEEIGRKEVVEKILQAAEMNLAAVGVFDCPLTVIGQAGQEDLKAWQPPAALNLADKIWGQWAYKTLPRKSEDGDLHHLCAQAVANPHEASSALATIFLITTDDDLKAPAQEEARDLLAKLLARLGDATFAASLAKAEPVEQAKILNALRKHQGKGAPVFPKTFAIKPKLGQLGPSEGPM